jgi:hypothetical protein
MLYSVIKQIITLTLLFTLIFPWYFFGYGVQVAYGQTYTYDLNGNLTSDGQREMTYNYNDRMSSLTINNETTNYFYDHTKTRVAKQNVQTNETTVYPNKFFGRKGEEEITRYVFLGNQRLAIIDNEGTHLNFSDHLNSSSVTTDLDGNITNWIDYLPYGSDRVNVQLSGNFNNKYKFTDKERDNESGLYN